MKDSRLILFLVISLLFSACKKKDDESGGNSVDNNLLIGTQQIELNQYLFTKEEDQAILKYHQITATESILNNNKRVVIRFGGELPNSNKTYTFQRGSFNPDDLKDDEFWTQAESHNKVWYPEINNNEFVTEGTLNIEIEGDEIRFDYENIDLSEDFTSSQYDSIKSVDMNFKIRYSDLKNGKDNGNLLE